MMLRSGVQFDLALFYSMIQLLSALDICAVKTAISFLVWPWTEAQS
jgi:hypothetical protein